jgi:hypothetical protein
MQQPERRPPAGRSGRHSPAQDISFCAIYMTKVN